MPKATKIKPEVQQCIDNCLECHSICMETITYCLEKGGKHAEANHIRLLQDCAQICQTSADFMIRVSDIHPQTCGVCAEVCERCAKSCEQFEGDAVMRRCAEMCHRCADSCRKMSMATV